MLKPVVIVCLGADALATPGNSIVGGQVVFARSFAEKLSPLRSTTLITLKFETLPDRKKTKKYPFNVIDIPLNGDIYYADSLWQNLEIIKERFRQSIRKEFFQDAIVISVYWISGYILNNGYFCRPYKWIHTHSSFGHLNANVTRSKSKKDYIEFRKNAELSITHAADYCWCTCNYELNVLKTVFGIPDDKILYFPRALDFSIFRSLKSSSKLPIWDIIYIGRIDERKGIFDIPVILSYLSGKQKYRIAIIGGGESEIKEYKNWFSHNYQDIYKNYILDFLPAVSHDDIPRYLAQSRVLLVPSHYEIFGNIAFEGVACGIPVVATTVGGIPEIIGDDTQGALFERGQFQTAAQSVEHFISESKFPRSNKSVPKIKKFFSWPYLIKRFMEMF